MPILALMLYGSCARGDASPESDIDLLAVHNEEMIARRETGRAILSLYPHATLRRMSSEGSLFVWHLISEGIELFDCANVFQDVRSSFTLKTDYSLERGIASEIGWSLLCEGAPVDTPEAVKAMLYAVRTIAISRLAERNTPAFSRRDVIARFPDPDIDHLWAEKYHPAITPAGRDALRRFLERNVGRRPQWASGTILDALNNKSVSVFALRKMLSMLSGSGLDIEYSRELGFTEKSRP